MDLKLNALIEHFHRTPMKVHGIYRYTFNPGSFNTTSSSPYPGIIFPVRGRSEYRFNNTPYLAALGNVIFGGANMKLDGRVIGDSEWSYVLVLYQSYEDVHADFRLENYHTQIKTGYSQKLYDLVKRMGEMTNLPGAFASIQRETLFRQAIEEIFRAAQNQSVGGTSEIFNEVSAYFNEHYSEEISISKLAADYKLNENQLYYLFKKYCGKGAGSYLLDLRLRIARELLVTSEKPISEISRSTGFNDPLYFSRVFRKRFGFSPSHARIAT